MTLTQQIITVAMVVLGTAVTRFLPFLIFPAGKPTPKYVQYLGKVLPAAVFGLLVVYSLKDVSILTGSHGIPELISIVLVMVSPHWRLLPQSRRPPPDQMRPPLPPRSAGRSWR